MKKNRVIWWNPYWAHCPAAKKKWAVLLNRYSVVGIVSVAMALSAALVIGVTHFAPQMPLLSIWNLAFQIPLLFGIFYLYAWIDRLIPARVVVKENRFVVQRGEAVAVVYFCDVKSVRITVFAEKLIRLTVRFRSKKGERTLRLGLPANLNLKEFLENFPCEKKIFDARDLFSKICRNSLKPVQVSSAINAGIVTK